ncbi:hypothetical protein ILUMI_04759 [Ignelater luminosus]|uniref:C2H2-type domain-containing protein n=1 Tax=Ignelater luminosus TaxID=2038154 RepID=A0A8K0GJA2_IGNLU|nr:hypothetical protein ILUMI_04759 [Ignelater luminosus]
MNINDATMRSFSTFTLLLHSIFFISANKRFYCPRCGKSYNQLNTLKRHLRLECGKEPQFTCELCLFRCKRKEHLKSHFFHRHSKHSLKQDPTLKQISMSPLRKIISPHAVLYYRRIYNKKCFSGRITHEYQCFTCGRYYKYIQSLRLHIKMGCGKEPKYFCKVNECPYKTKWKGNLKGHLIGKHGIEVALIDHYMREIP